jgi:phytoene/squalene synthetase
MKVQRMTEPSFYLTINFINPAKRFYERVYSFGQLFRTLSTWVYQKIF